MRGTTDDHGSILARSLRPGDAPAVFDLTAAAELHDSGRVLVELDDILGDWARPSYNQASQSLGLFAGSRLVSYAEVDRKRLEGYVDPACRGRGLGTALVTWAVETARKLGYERLGQSLPVTNAAAIELLRSFGSEVPYTSWILELPADATIADTTLPSGHRLRGFDRDRDARDVFQTIEDAFNEWPNREASTFADWEAATLARGDFEPWQITVAVKDVGGVERVVGACKVTATDSQGWVDSIGVRRDARGRGLGRALLASAFTTVREHGATTSRLNTDSRTGALGLYEHVGMVVVETLEHHAIRLAPEPHAASTATTRRS